MTPTPIPSEVSQVGDEVPQALINEALDCENWPLWLHDIVDRVTGTDLEHDMSTEQAIGLALLLSRRSLDSGDGVEDLAAVLWRTELVDAGVPQSAIEGRTRAAFEGECVSTKDRWRKFARAALASRSRNTEVVVKAEPVAWEGHWPGAGSINSQTVLTRFRDTMEKWAKDGAEITPLYASPPSPAQVTFQDRVAEAHIALFHDDPTDLPERRDRFFEEAIETVQSLDMTADEAHQLVEYTFGRAPGDVRKEIGASALTLASLCVIGGWDMMECAEADLAALRTPEKIAKVRAKRATRYGRGPLPGLDAVAPQAQPSNAEADGTKPS